VPRRDERADASGHTRRPRGPPRRDAALRALGARGAGRLPRLFGRNAYSSIYYTLLGADHAHVALGVLFDLWLLGKLATGLTRYRVRATWAIALYWHAVNLITVVVIATLLSAAL